MDRLALTYDFITTNWDLFLPLFFAVSQILAALEAYLEKKEIDSSQHYNYRAMRLLNRLNSVIKAFNGTRR